MVVPYHPITIEGAAEILSVSRRTIYNLVAQGALPQPIAIGRRVYWHPDAFFAGLDRHLQTGAHRPGCPPPAPTRRVGRPRARLIS